MSIREIRDLDLTNFRETRTRTSSTPATPITPRTPRTLRTPREPLRTLIRKSALKKRKEVRFNLNSTRLDGPSSS